MYHYNIRSGIPVPKKWIHLSTIDPKELIQGTMC